MHRSKPPPKTVYVNVYDDELVIHRLLANARRRVHGSATHVALRYILAPQPKPRVSKSRKR